jgi:Hint domain
MNKLTRARTRRHLMRIAAAGALNIPLIGCEPVEPRTARRRRTAQTVDAKCFLRGAKISTPTGEIPVDELDIGDAICTLDGIKRVKWIGRKKIRNASNDEAWNVRPIRVARFALDDKTPHRDLYMSAGHRLFLNEVLIPVMYLVNDATVAPHFGWESIEYYHVEFDTHEVIFAEGAAVESYSGSHREWFDNFAEFERIYGAQALGINRPYAPIMGYNGGRDELMGLLRSLVSNVIDIRDPIQVAYDTIAGRAAAGFPESHAERS